jgi:peptide/nickel transport system substrate-binding protein
MLRFRDLAILVAFLMVGAAFAQDQELVIARPTDALSLDAQQESTAPGAWVYGNVIEPMIALAPDGSLVPRLATSWEYVDDTRLRFTLREGVTFHDGTPFNAEAVKFTWDRALFADPPGRWSGLAGPVEAVEVVDDYTVDVVASVPYGPLLLTASMIYTGVVSPSAVQELGEGYSRNPVGTGPFKFVEWVTNERIVLEANDDYWRGRPELDRVVFRVIPEDGARMLSLRTGEVDMVLNPPPSDLAAFEADPGFEIAQADSVQVYYLGFNLEKAPADDVRVRQAVQHALDVPLIVESVLEGGATVATSVISPGVFGHIDMELSERYPYDPDAAAALLEEAGWVDSDGDGIRERDGERLVLEALPANGRYLRDLEVAEVVQEFLRQVGIELQLDVFEWATTFPLSQEDPLQYHMVTFAWLTTTTDADYTLFSNFHSEELPPNSWNKYRYANDQVDAWLEEARASVDPEVRADLYARVQEQLAVDLPSIPIYNTNELAVHSTAVQGFVTHPVQYILDLYPVSLADQ